jgi:uncharacterized protein YbjT (DUF2867 family)
MIVVTTPTGHIGSKVVRHLLAANEAVRVVVRDPAKLSPEVLAKVEVVQGSTDDEAVLYAAFEGAESVFWVVPPSFQASDITAYYLQFTSPAARAIKARGVKRTVSISALGRGHALKSGLGDASYAMVEELEKTGADTRALYCPGFMENMLHHVQSLKHPGSFSLPGPADWKVPLATTGDIAHAATKLLLDRAWKGQGGAAVLGPADLSNNELAAILTEVLGKPIQFQPISAAAYEAHLVSYGAHPVFAKGLTEMLVAKGQGLDNAEERTAENTTPTTFKQWATQVLRPAVVN